MSNHFLNVFCSAASLRVERAEASRANQCQVTMCQYVECALGSSIQMTLCRVQMCLLVHIRFSCTYGLWTQLANLRSTARRNKYHANRFREIQAKVRKIYTSDIVQTAFISAITANFMCAAIEYQTLPGDHWRMQQ